MRPSLPITRPEFVTPRHLKQVLDVSTSSLLRWADANKIRFIRTLEGGRRLYHENDVRAQLGMPPVEAETNAPKKVGKTILYARVSSPHQRPDLERQCATLREQYPDGELIQDIGSGLNWKRTGLHAILERAIARGFTKLVVTHRDRLARIAVELIEWFLQKYSIELVVLGKSTSGDEGNDETELRDDLLAITTFFVARNNGLRSATNRKRRNNSSSSHGTNNDDDEKVKETEVINA